ncbi:rim15, signal transduction response regulator [Knufia peltigerae]|uniref:non-specific serine/threonine protein kinase n=1 Tax=Knufia peltigerae TaxID=1002370 RepID=A0AA38YC07_9EURO|nr:rim15, signal transduction response regulator [Knufia peltigerae]
MAEDGSPPQFLEPPTITALKSDAGFGGEVTRHAMERSFSQDIQEGTQDLKEAAEQTRNIILDLGLDGHIRWVSPSWTDVVGTQLDAVKGHKISEFISDKPDVFDAAIEALKSNDSKSQYVKFAVKIGATSVMAPMLETEHGHGLDEDDVETDDTESSTLELEGQGIMVYDRSSGGESHSMWMLQPAQEPVRIEIALPQALVDTLGVGAEILAKYLTELAESGANDPENHPPPLPILCRVCERSIVPWWFEKHSDLCVQEHRAELDVQMIQENLSEHRNAIVKVLDAFEARQGRNSTDDSSSPSPTPEYKGLPIGPSPVQSSAASSASASHTASPVRSRSPSTAGLGHARARSFVVRRPLVRVVELILDLCDTAIEINVPSIKDSKSNDDDDFRSQSPQSESRISQVMQWQAPISLENEPGLAALSADTEKLARSKVDAVRRHQYVLEYSERIRQEYMAEVDACINEALIKAERVAAGEALSSDSESEPDLALEDVMESTGEDEQPTPLAVEAENSPAGSYVGLRSMASALRNPRDIPYISMKDQRRSSSQAVSTGSSSPIECPTPKSHKSNLISQPQPVSNRRSIYLDDANDSDSSLPSSSVMSNTWRPESPASVSEHGRSAHSRDRKRRSLHLHGLNSASPHRQQSPGRYPPPPPSPLRMTKSRIPSGEIAQSPVVSPLLTAGEYMPPAPGPLLHRRQSSMHSSDKTPSSPHLSSISHPQQRVQPPSIKDFEVIKPISRGAFGSVYLAKKKITGEYFAIKVLRKSDMVAKNQVTNVKAERAIMMWQGESDFVAKLYWTFSSKDYLYLVMEYLNGGDCASLVKILGGLSEDWAKKYIAEVVLGVEHLHSRGIVHRDLKPDNLLIDSKGHLKLTDFGLSRMGLIGRQKRALKQPEEPAPDLLKQGPFTHSGTGSGSNPTSRSASFDYEGPHSPTSTPLMTPALAGGLDQPSYFNLNRESSLTRELSWSRSGQRSDSGSSSSFDLHHLFKKLGVQENNDTAFQTGLRTQPVDEELYSVGSQSPDIFPLSQSLSNISQPPPPPASSQVLPPLFDGEDSGKRFVGTPDYLAPETINGTGQDEMCDWWALGCIMFEFLYGIPPFNAESTEEVFDNILNRRIAWPEDDEIEVSSEAKDLINKLIQLDPADRLGANKDEIYPSGGAEIQAHPWFADINWTTLLEDEAQFIPNPEHPEDTEYFDARGATLSSFPEELEDQISPSGTTPNGPDYPNRPHDALLRVRTQAASSKRGLMPLHIPPHVARDTRSRRLSEPVIVDDFGNFTFKNLPVLEKANKDIVEKMRKEAMQAQARGYSHSQAISAANSPAVGSPAPSLEGSPMMPMPVKRALSISKGHRPGSPSSLGGTSNSSPSRPSQPSSPLLVQFSAAQHHERRKTSGSSQGSSSLNPGSFFDIPHDAIRHNAQVSSSPVKTARLPAVSPAKAMNPPQRQTSATVNGRTRSQTVGSQESDGQPPRDNFIPGHYKRKSQLLARDVSPSSSDNESAQAKALLKVQRRRQSSRRMSQINFLDGPVYRPLDVLICEDHPVSRMVMERLLEKLRCRTVTATNGPDALRLAVSQIQFDIIFMEFKLPLINGVDVARMIRDTKSANTHTPIVCITGYLKDLPEVHHFDTLMQKPPTSQKLSEMLCKYCSWKPPPKDFKLAAPLHIPPISTRVEHAHTQDSPSSVASSLAPTMPDSSYKGSAREDSIGSGGFFSDLESFKSDDIPVIVSRAATDEWAKGGLGISDDIVTGQKPYVQSGFPHLIQTESAPASANVEETPGYGLRTPRRQKSSEIVRQKRDRLERSMQNPSGAAEEGDDEDEELGDVQVRSRSPVGKAGRPTSKLGIEMMRTNSRGSVISMNDDKSGESDNLRQSLEILEERMESLTIPEEPSQATVIASQPRKSLERAASYHSHPEQESERRPSHGQITPPVIFPRKPGTQVAHIDPGADVTPTANRTVDKEEEEPTPKPLGSPSGATIS